MAMSEPCPECGHTHSGIEYAYICIGCPCPETPGKPAPQSFGVVPAEIRSEGGEVG